jgi:alpha-beta hydrolase superfamily lysophospholipase
LGERAFTIATHTASDGYVWHYRRYLPTSGTAARAHVVMLHGIQSHGGWYEYSCTRLAEAGFAVSFLDRRGSGLNQEARGDTPSLRRLVDDIAEFLSPSPPHLVPLSPTFLVGISWGAKLAVALPCCRPVTIDGVVLLCPGFFPRIAANQKRGAFLLGLVGWLRPKRRFSIPLNDPALFTESPRWQEFLRNDPLALHDATARFLAASTQLDRYLRFVPEHFSLPTLLLLAENDRIIDNAATRRFVGYFVSTDKEIIEYPGAHHTLEFEPEPDRFVNDLIHWLRRQSAAPSH